MILCLFTLLAIPVFSTPDLGVLDEARYIDGESRKTGASFSLMMLVGTNYWTINPADNINVYPVFEKEDFSHYQHLVIPSFSLSFIDIIGLEKRTELSYKINFTSPSFNKWDIFGPSFFVDFGVKKNILDHKHLFISYKFSWGLGYNAYPGMDLAIRNALLIGTNTDKIIFNVVPSFQNSLVLGLSSYNVAYPFVLPASPIFTLVPGLELNWSLNFSKKLIFLVGLHAKYEVCFELYYGNHIQGNFNLGIHFSWMTKYKKEKTIDYLNDDIYLDEETY